ncbi:MAG TPA: multicopper oxidase domain-containing protein [Pyrinomonadaceae bacterium]|jgi:Tol biopolymer transport system component
MRHTKIRAHQNYSFRQEPGAFRFASVFALTLCMLMCNLWTAQARRIVTEGISVADASTSNTPPATGDATTPAEPSDERNAAEATANRVVDKTVGETTADDENEAAGASSLAAAAGATSSALAVVQSPADAALLVVGSTTLNGGDSAIKLRLETLGYAVTLKDAVSAATADATGKAVVYISETCNSEHVLTKFRDVTVPVVVAEAALFDDMAMTGSTSTVDWANTMSQTNLVINDPTHPLAAGLKGEVTVTNSPQHFAWGRPSAGAERVARLRNQPEQFGVFGYERGASMISLDAPARRVGIFLFGDTPPALNNDGWALFDAAINWVTKSVLMVVGSTALNASDGAIKSRLESLGYKVVLKDGASMNTADAVGMSVVFVSETITATDVGTKLRDIGVPVVVSDAALFDDMQMTGNVLDTDYNNLGGQTQLAIADASHPLAAGFPAGAVTVATIPQSFAWGRPALSAAKVATVLTDSNKTTIYGYERGASMVGMNAPARRVGFFLTGDAAAYLNNNGWALFDAAINWAIQPPTVLFVTGSVTLNSAENAVISRLSNLGFKVRVKNAASTTTADANDKTLVYIPDTVPNADVNTKFRDVTVPVMISKAFLFDEMGMTGAVSGTDNGYAGSESGVLITNPNHPLAAGFTGTVGVVSAPQQFAWGKPNVNAAKVATLAGNTNRATIFGYERGAVMVSATAKGRRVGYYLSADTAASLNNNGWELFDAAVRWATYSEKVPASPTLKPNGKIVFTSARDGNNEIYSMNADGTVQTRLTNNAANDSDPAWSPDGTQIAFTSTRDGNEEIYLMNADGTNLRRLTDNPANDNDAAWSPDGTQLAFTSNRDGNYEIYVVFVDGFGLTNITNFFANDRDPAWSPDGSKIAYRHHASGDDEIHVMNSDGTQPTRLTNASGGDEEPFWSPDGRRIAFTAQRDGNREIYVMNSDGAAQLRLTNNTALDDDAAWSPDGTKISFTSARNSNHEIYYMNTDGAAQTRLTNNTVLDEEPHWQAIVNNNPAPTPTPTPTPTTQPTPLPTPVVGDTIEADVVALDYAFFYNRYGAFNPAGMIYALRRDVVPINSSLGLAPGNVRLREGKRARPLVLRMNVGQKLKINFQNLLGQNRANDNQPKTRAASVHVVGLQLVNSINDDGSNVGVNTNSLVEPGGSITYTYDAEREGNHLFYSTAATTGGEGDGGTLAMGLFGMVNVEPKGAEWYRSQVTRQEMEWATIGRTPNNQPIINYDAVYPAGHPRVGQPILRILQGNQIVHDDLRAIITGPARGAFPPGTYESFPVQPNRNQPFREFTLVYHDEIKAVQAFPQFFEDPILSHTLHSVRDAFAINYGTGGIGSEVLANRLGVGPVHDCPECLYEEFFLTSWAVGDPAMIVDVPANTQNTSGQIIAGPKATKAFFPEDPSNTYPSYLNDPVKMRIAHAGPKEHHIHHLHAHQWLHTPDSENSTTLDSQAFGPGFSFVTDILRGSGNRNKTPGDAIFHCHFYPHFAMGMWGLWRVHDVFEEGTPLDAEGRPVPGTRAYPDGEIARGTPIPALVPIPTLAMPPMPQAQVSIVNGQPQVAGTGNPGYPFFVPGVAGHRPPHPPLDTVDDGGLPRHIIVAGESEHEENRLSFDKRIVEADAKALPEQGTPTEQAAMNFHAQRTHASFTPAGTPGFFFTNGLPPQSGAPFADPCVNDDGLAIGNPRLYKSANIQLDVKFNKAGWHFPQQRISALWDDVAAFKNGTRPPEPLFFRGNTNDCITFQFTNLVPKTYEVDDFQVKTPTDIMGQHIHLVKFDVLASDGAANGWNYEDGSFSPGEVQERIEAINARGGLEPFGGGTRFSLTPKPHPFFGVGPDENRDGKPDYLGAQTTISRWFADDVRNRAGEDRTLRTAFTHDHFGPSTHQQVGLYAGLVIEPRGSTWRHSETGQLFGTRFDGGPTSFRADILTANPSDSYREFLIEFADFQHAYKDGGGVDANGLPVPDPARAINPPGRKEVGLPFLLEPPDKCPVLEGHEANAPAPPCPEAISADDVGTFVVNYRNEPIPLRIVDNPDASNPQQATGLAGDLSHVYRSDISRAFAPMNTQPNFYPRLTGGVFDRDPFTPLLRAYEDDKVQIRILIGAHEEGHNFGVHGIKWLFEPSDPNSGYRNNQMMGISEHFEFVIPSLPKSSIGSFADYLYQPGVAVDDQWNGLWGIMRAYNRTQNDLQPLPNNPDGHGPVINNVGDFNGVCPKTAPTRNFNVSAILARDALPDNTLVYNPRTNMGGRLHDPTAILYVRDADLDANGKLATNQPEPLILRANAGDCINLSLTNRLPENAFDLDGFNTLPMIVNHFNANQVKPSTHVGLHPQLVFFDVTRSDGANVGFNKVQTAAPGHQTIYQWFAGDMTVRSDGFGSTAPIEFGATNLQSSDPIKHSNKGAIGALIIEPQGATWVESPNIRAQATVTHAGGSFREFVLLHQTDINLRFGGRFDENGRAAAVPNLAEAEDPEDSGQKAFNYRTEPLWKRMGFEPNTPLEQTREVVFTNSLRNSQVVNHPGSPVPPASMEPGDPVTPVFTAAAGTPIRFRLLMPGGHARNSVFNLHGHIWEELPWINASTMQGHNPFSQWEGTRYGIGAGSHFNLLLKNGAGGRFQVRGDYLYRNQTSFLFDGGMWGIFRVQ